MARTKLDEDMIKFLCTAHENGAPQTVCAKLANIDRKTLYNWIQKGKHSKRGKFHDFYVKWENADGKFQTYHLRNITEHAKKDWRASRYLLEVANPQEFVIQEKIQNVNKTEVSITKPKSFKEEMREYETYFEELEQERQGFDNEDSSQE